MKAVVIVLALLMTVGLAWGPTPVLAEGEVVFQQLPACQPVSDAELSQISGKQLPPINFCQIARCVYNHLPPDTQQRVCCVVQTIKAFSHCFNNNNTNNTTNGNAH